MVGFALCLVLTLGPISADALSQAQLYTYYEGALYFDVNSSNCNAATGSTISASAPTPTLQAFVDKYGSMAYQNSITTGVPYEFTLAQAMVESSYGSSQLSAQYNNFFGIKAGVGWTGQVVWMPTQEYQNGSFITINAPFRAYPTAAASFADHDAFFKANPRYANALQYTTDPIKFLDAIAADGYATDPNYTQTVGSLITQVEQYVASKNMFPPSSQVAYKIANPSTSPTAGTTPASTAPTAVLCSCYVGSNSSTASTLDPSLVPPPYNTIFSAAGQKYGVAPAFIAAIFYGGEHGDSFPTPPPPYGNGSPWLTSPSGAEGPFQFLPSTWSKVGVDGNGDGKVDIEDLTDSAFSAANYLANDLHAANTTDEQTLRQAAANYNGDGNPNGSYADQVWTAFQKFNGSSTAAASSSNATCPSSSSASVDGYMNPYRGLSSPTPMRIDEGVDYGGSGPIYAIGSGTVVVADNGNAQWPGGNYVSYQLNSGPAAGKIVYMAENCPLAVHVGEAVTSSTVICNLINSFPFSEMGWAYPASYNDTPLAHYVYIGVPDGTATAYGVNFNQLLVKLGAQSGTYQFSYQQGGKSPAGTLPAGWPTW